MGFGQNGVGAGLEYLLRHLSRPAYGIAKMAEMRPEKLYFLSLLMFFNGCSPCFSGHERVISGSEMGPIGNECKA